MVGDSHPPARRIGDPERVSQPQPDDRARHRHAYAGLALWLLGAGACGPIFGESPEPVVLTLGVADRPGSLSAVVDHTDRHLALSAVVDHTDRHLALSAVVDQLTTEPLADATFDGRREARIAVRWTVDRASATVVLRSDIEFHDGTPLTAEVIAGHLDETRGDAPLGPRFPWRDEIVDIEVPSPYVLRIGLATSSQLLLDSLLATRPRRTSSNGTRIGTGPFQIDGITSGTIRLRANPTYPRGRPSIDVVEVRTYATTWQAWADMRRGALDVLYDVPLDTRELVEADSGVQLFPFDSGYTYALIFNHHTPVFRAPDVRIALNIAIDRRAIIDGALHGRGTLASGLSPSHWIYGGDDRVHRFDPQRADQLLTASGYPPVPGGSPRYDGVAGRLRFVCLVPDASPFEELALRLQRQLAQSGVDMVIEAVAPNDFASRLAGGDYEAALARPPHGKHLALLTAAWGDAGWSAQGARTPGALGVRYPRVVEVLGKLHRELDQHRRRRLAAELQRVFYEDPPAIFIANQRHARALSRRFTPPEGAGDDILDTLWRWRQTDGLDTQ